MSRIRSPNYPACSLPVALDKARAIHKAEGTNAVSREAIAKHLGFGSINGASATTLSALGKYGLIEAGQDGEARVTQLAMRILFAESSEEKRAAITEAAFKPALFAELRDKWPDRPPSNESLRSFLIRRGVSEGALDQVIQFYRETIDIATSAGEAHDSSTSPTDSGDQMTGKPASPTPSGVLPNGRPFSIAFDGTMVTGTLALSSIKDIERLIKVLNAQKAAMVAMQDDDNQGETMCDSGGPLASSFLPVAA